MATIPTSPSLSSSASGTLPQATVAAATVVQASSSVLDLLSAAKQVAAVVTGQGSNGLVNVSTAFGALQVKVAGSILGQLTPGSALVLSVPAGTTAATLQGLGAQQLGAGELGAQAASAAALSSAGAAALTLRLQLVPSSSPSPSSPPQVATTGGNGANGTSGSNSAATSVANGVGASLGLRAAVIAPPAQSASGDNAGGGNSGGSNSGGANSGGANAGGGSATVSNSGGASSASAAATANPSGAASSSPSGFAGMGGSGLPVGTILTVRLVQVTSPDGAQAGTPSAGTPSSLADGQLQGQVADQRYGSAPVVFTPAGVLVINTRQDLPPGSVVVLDVVATQAVSVTLEATSAEAAAQAAAAARAEQAADGPVAALRQSLDLLRQMAPTEAASLLSDLPQPGGQLALGLLTTVQSLVSAEQAKAPGYGKGIKALEGLGNKLAAGKLSQAFAGKAEAAANTSGAWRGFSIPVLNGQEIEEISLYVRPPPPEDFAPDGPEGEGTTASGRVGGGEGTRFLVDLHLSQLGAMQFDGLVKSNLKRFDLILRTAQILPLEMRQDISRIFRESCDLSGVAGEIVFQADRPFIVAAPPTGRASSPISGVASAPGSPTPGGGTSMMV